MSSLRCVRCHNPLPENAEQLVALTQCPWCGTETTVAVFPAFGRTQAVGTSPQLILEQGEAACFYHPDKRAITPCAACGRFLCALCDVEVSGSHYCPGCLEAGARTGNLQSANRGVVRYDRVVWALLGVPLLLCSFALPVTSLAAIGVAIWKWRCPPSLVINIRRSLGIGIALAVIEFALGGLLWFLVFLR